MRKLLNYLKPYIIYTILAPLLMIIEVSSELIIPRIMSSIVDTGIAQGNNAYIISRGLLMILTALCGVVGGVGCTVCASKASQGFGTDVREAMLEKIQSFSFVNLDKFHTSSLVTRLTNDITQAQLIVLMSLRMLVRSPFMFIGGLTMAFLINVKLTFVLVAAVAILGATIVLVIRHTFPLFRLVQEKIDNVNTIMRDALSGVRVIKAFVRGEEEKHKFDERNRDLRDTTISAFRIMTLIMPVMMFVLNNVIIIILWRGGNMVYSGSMETGDLMAYITYINQILMSFMMVGMALMQMTRGKASIDRINEVLETETDIKDSSHPNNAAVTHGNIVFDNVSFAYPKSTGDPVLENISLDIKSGETVGILGETGAGKSTLVNLIPRLYDVTEGSIKIDGTDVRDIGLDYLRNSIGIVLQKPILFSGTIKENIKWGKADASDDDIISAAKDAQAYEFITEMPDGFNTELGQMGVNISGGQKQRVSIARTIIKKPKILIFDDSTSALDTATEARIQKALRENYSGITKIIIAQKITSVMHADKIVIINSGRITAVGDHDYLIKNSSEYQEIYNSQLKREDDR